MPSSVPDINLIEQVIRQITPRSSQFQVERAAEGISTYVYRIRRANETLYLRVLSEAHASFAPEVIVHQRLRAQQVRVPDVLYFEHCNQVLERSLMLTTEIAGTPLSHSPDSTHFTDIVRAVGRDLALINRLAVEGFGWICRDSQEVTQLQAEFPDHRAWIGQHLESDLAALRERALSKEEVTGIYQILKRFDHWLDEEPALLAHGDFDVSHIYQDQGCYTGIIDFGEIRGAARWYDLAHFNMYEGENIPLALLPDLLSGYQEVTALEAEHKLHIAFTSLLIAIRALAQTLTKRPQHVHRHPGLRSIPRDMQQLCRV